MSDRDGRSHPHYRKFGKYIQKKQLEIPEYAASFVDYKALKKLIKELKNSPIHQADAHPAELQHDPQSVLQANKAPFFFRLSKVRLRVLIDKQRALRMRHPVVSKSSSDYITLDQGFRDFIKDLSKLQQFIEINATAFAKILKKWDKTSKSQMKELYLSRAVEVQPCFNHDVISELSDQANSSLLDCAAWAEGETTSYGDSVQDQKTLPTPRLEQDEADQDALDALNRGDIQSLKGLIHRLQNSTDADERLTKLFLNGVSAAPEEGLMLILETGLVDYHRRDEINERNCLHKTAMTGKRYFLLQALAAGVDPSNIDAYGRIPLHYACMNGHVKVVQDLLEAQPATADVQDLDNYSGLIHAIVRGHLACVEKILSYSARVDAERRSDHIPLNLACQYGSQAIVELLLRGNPKLMPDVEGLYPQHLVARFGCDPEIFLMLQAYGANLDQPDRLYQWTPLLHAASEGRVDCLKRLIECGVDARALDEKGLSAQYYATWEGHLACMETLAAVAGSSRPEVPTPAAIGLTANALQQHQSEDVEMIPDLSLPPPIIPTRRYGHNFLQNKTTVVISFDDRKRKAVAFDDESKYPAARLTIAPRSSDIISRNILLPIQDENQNMSFEMDRLDLFSVDFDVYPTYGKKVVAKGSVPADVFQKPLSSAGYHNISLLDPRLRSVGQVYFKYQVIKPFAGVPLDITPFATYWKATSQAESQPTSLVTGSSLSGEHVRLFVQLSRDGVPILFPKWTIACGGVDVPVIGLSYKQFTTVGRPAEDRRRMLSDAIDANERSQYTDLPLLHQALAHAQISLDEALSLLPAHVHIEMHILYPNEEEEMALRLGPTMNINQFVDNMLEVVFQHARHSREHTRSSMRSIVFSSYNRDLCTALNWKQPNCKSDPVTLHLQANSITVPVLLCNDLGAKVDGAIPQDRIQSSGRTTMSIKEAVRIAQSNNFMGLVCRSRILDTIPALIQAIKIAGLVLISDASDSPEPKGRNPAVPVFSGVPDGIAGVLKSNGIMRFNESIDV